MRLFLSLILSIHTACAINLNYFNSHFEKSLVKDQEMIIVVKEAGDEKLLTFRWTLFHNQGLVTLMNYNGEPSQQLLYKRYQENSIKLDIALRNNETSRFHPYLIITFLGYNYENKSAQFEVFHKDPSSLTSVQLR